MKLYNHPDLGDREDKMDMLITLLNLGPNPLQMVFVTLMKEDDMEFGLYMFELYLKHSLTEVYEYVEVFKKMLALKYTEPADWK